MTQGETAGKFIPVQHQTRVRALSLVTLGSDAKYLYKYCAGDGFDAVKPCSLYSGKVIIVGYVIT